MGGLEIDENSAVLGSDSEAIGGLNAAGEVAGGVHGNNRSSGNSFLDCAGFRPRNRRSMCQVRVERQDEGSFPGEMYEGPRVVFCGSGRDVFTDSEQAMMSAVAQQPMSIAIEADQYSFQL